MLDQLMALLTFTKHTCNKWSCNTDVNGCPFVDSGDGLYFIAYMALDCSLIPMLCYVIIVCACVTHMQL